LKLAGSTRHKSGNAPDCGVFDILILLRCILNHRLGAVTALYDIGRHRIDGRTIETYIEWLNATLRAPLPFTIFLDPGIDAARVAAKPGDRIVPVPLPDFVPYGWRERVLTATANASNEITNALPDYSLLMFSKFDMLARTAAETDANGLLWVDAGLSRFFAKDLAETHLNSAFIESQLAPHRLCISATPTLAEALECRQFRKDHVGTMHRLASGGDFYVRTDAAAAIAEQIFDLVENQWLAKGRWDNEQVGLGYLMMQGVPGSAVTFADRRYANFLWHTLGLPERVPHQTGGLGGKLLRLLKLE
jgi:hypothetical protein